MRKLSKKTEKAFKDACKKTGRPESIDLSSFPEDMREQAMAQYMLMVITEAKNDGWKADWNDSTQRKWFPWIWFSPSGVRFDGSCYGTSHANAGLAASLCFNNESLSDAAGKKFTEPYSKFIN